MWSRRKIPRPSRGQTHHQLTALEGRERILILIFSLSHRYRTMYSYQSKLKKLAVVGDRGRYVILLTTRPQNMIMSRISCLTFHHLQIVLVCLVDYIDLFVLTIPNELQWLVGFVGRTVVDVVPHPQFILL